MDLYFVNKQVQPNGDHEVHKQTCAYLPSAANQQSLGWHSSCREAVRAAKAFYSQCNGCYWCSRECHTY
jgi:ferredoxin